MLPSEAKTVVLDDHERTTYTTSVSKDVDFPLADIAEESDLGRHVWSPSEIAQRSHQVCRIRVKSDPMPVDKNLRRPNKEGQNKRCHLVTWMDSEENSVWDADTRGK